MLTEDDLQKIRLFIYKETGMLFEDRKDYYLKTRLEMRMQNIGISGFHAYYQELVYNAGERQHFIEAVTINETYFFRDFPQLQGFGENALPSYIDGRRKFGKKSLKVWSAACSTGEEAYTISIILQEVIEDCRSWSLRIDATDIDTKVIAHARHGLYGGRAMKDTPLIYRDKYFREMNGDWQVQENASRIVHFKQLNFMNRTAMREMHGYDFIFCRNVLIYFDEISRKNVVNALYDALLPGGYLFLGHSESIGRITSAFEVERIGGLIFHRKPTQKAA